MQIVKSYFLENIYDLLFVFLRTHALLYFWQLSESHVLRGAFHIN